MWQRPAGILIYLVGGEAIQSALHFGLDIALLNRILVRDYGVFALIMVIGGIGITYIRALTALPASAFIAKSHSEAAANAYEVSFGLAALVLSTLLATIVVVLTNGWLDRGALNGGAFVGLWGLRSHIRTVLLARKLRAVVSFGDLTFVSSGTAGAALALFQVSNRLDLTFLAMACANGIGIGTMLTLARRPVRVHAGRHGLRRYCHLWPNLKWSLFSVTIVNLQGQGMALLVATLAGPAAYGPIAAALVLFVPLRIVSTAFGNMVQPELSALVRQCDVAGVRRLMWLWPGPLALLCLFYGVAIAALMPWIEPIGLQNADSYMLVILAWVMCSLPLLYAMLKIWLEIRLDYRAIAILSALAAAIGLSIVLVALQRATPSLALVGGAASEFVVLCGSWILVGRSQKRVLTL